MMGKEIVVSSGAIEAEISELRRSIQALETSFAKEIEGDNQLEMIATCNEIKQQYDEILDQFASLFIHNVESTDDAIVEMIETEKRVAGDIQLVK